ncbi:MAG: UBP-type zinc finger domain-containing protein [Chitinophagaceae bacterium]
MSQQICFHIESIKELKLPNEQVCKECIKQGGSWVHLRTCQTCGVTLCCDSSPSRHMTQHNHQTHHPVIISAQPGERWFWCYEDELFVEY